MGMGMDEERTSHLRLGKLSDGTCICIKPPHQFSTYPYLFLSERSAGTKKVNEARRDAAVYVEDEGFPLLGGHLWEGGISKFSYRECCYG